MDEHGKDPRNDISRWRLVLHYHPNFAATMFFDNESDYQNYITGNMDDCFSDYMEYSKEFESYPLN